MLNPARNGKWLRLRQLWKEQRHDYGGKPWPLPPRTELHDIMPLSFIPSFIVPVYTIAAEQVHRPQRPRYDRGMSPSEHLCSGDAAAGNASIHL
jgi:hypothetical protein